MKKEFRHDKNRTYNINRTDKIVNERVYQEGLIKSSRLKTNPLDRPSNSNSGISKNAVMTPRGIDASDMQQEALDYYKDGLNYNIQDADHRISTQRYQTARDYERNHGNYGQGTEYQKRTFKRNNQLSSTQNENASKTTKPGSLTTAKYADQRINGDGMTTDMGRSDQENLGSGRYQRTSKKELRKQFSGSADFNTKASAVGRQKQQVMHMYQKSNSINMPDDKKVTKNPSQKEKYEDVKLAHQESTPVSMPNVTNEHIATNLKSSYNGYRERASRTAKNKDNKSLKNDLCSSTHTAISGGKLGIGAGVADFVESGSNYGHVNNVDGYNKFHSKKEHRPWRKFNAQDKKISEIIDDTSVLTKSLTALNSKVNNAALSNQMLLQDGIEIGVNTNFFNNQRDNIIEETEGDNGEIYKDGTMSDNDRNNQTPIEYSEIERQQMNFSGSRNEVLSGITCIVPQCKLKRQRFMFLGHDVHSFANFGGKAGAPKAFKSQIALIRDRTNQTDEVQSERTMSSVAIQANKYKPSNISAKAVKLAKSQCKVSRPTIMSQCSFPVSPRANLSDQSQQEIESIHSDEEDLYLQNDRGGNRMRHGKKDKIRPSEETIFMSTQQHDSLHINPADERNDVRKQSNKALQTSIALLSNDQMTTTLSPMTTPLQSGGAKVKQSLSAQKVRVPMNKNKQWPAVSQECEAKPNVAQCEVLPVFQAIQACQGNNLLKAQEEEIQRRKNSKNAKDTGEDDFKYIENFMKTTQIQCFKYNSSLDSSGQQKQFTFDAYISLSNDGKSLVITNIRPSKGLQLDEFQDKIEVPKHTSDDEDDESNTKDASETAAYNPDDLQPQMIFEEIEQLEEMEVKMQEMKNRQQTKKLSKSSASCKISEIDSFIYGGFSSRFWILRKHVNSLSKKELQEVPFHSWNCITLNLGRRDVDLVIKDENHMQIFIKYLVYSLCTLDGTKNSAKPLLNHLIQTEIEQFKQKTGKSWVRQTQEEKIVQMYQSKLFNQVAFKYKIMKMRAKIGFIALQKGLTIQEIFLHAIYKTYIHFIDHYNIDPNEYFIQADQMYQGIISFEKNLKMIAEGQREQDKSGMQGQNTQISISMNKSPGTGDVSQNQQFSMNANVQTDKMIQLNNFKNSLKQSWQIVLDPSLGNPYKKYENQAKNPELYTKEQLRNKKRRGSPKKKGAKTTRPSAAQINQILRKDKVMEIFKDVMVDKAESLFSNQNIASFVAIKFKKKINLIRYSQLNIFINMRLIRGPRYIEALLARIRLSKEMFLLDLQQGMEALIPYDLSQDHLPMSFRYYDFILQLVQDSVSQDRRDFQKIKMKLAKLFDSKLSLKETIGLSTFLNKFKKKKQNVIQQNNLDEQNDDIDYNKSQHTKQVQRSRYLLLNDDRVESSDSEDNNVDDRHQRPMKEILGLQIYRDTQEAEELEENQQKNDQTGKVAMPMKQNNIAIKYLKATEVLQRRQKATYLKHMFQNNLNTLKQKGHFLEQTQFVNAWLEDNIDQLYEKERRRRILMNPEQYDGLPPEKETKEFMKYKKFLAACAEEMLRDHRVSVQKRKTMNFQNKLSLENREDRKLRVLDDMIEENILYFNAKVGDKESMQIQSIKAQIRNRHKKWMKRQQSHSANRSQFDKTLSMRNARKNNDSKVNMSRKE